MHNPALLAIGQSLQYVRVRVPVGSVAEALRSFASAGFLGVNITIPHKFEALAAVDDVDPLAATLGAVNTVHIRDGKLIGYNSDGPGFLAAVREAFATEVKGLRVMVLGAGGGAGRAVAVQCALAGCRELVLVNRSAEKLTGFAGELAGLHGLDPDLKLKFILGRDWNDANLRAALRDVDLIVNGTSLGMKPDDATLVPPNAIEARHMVFDMVYRAGSQSTALGTSAKEAGARYVDGVTLLLHQGAISFEHWFGQKAPLEVMRAGLRAALNP